MSGRFSIEPIELAGPVQFLKLAKKYKGFFYKEIK